MALGDIGMFLPGEAQYTKPGTYDQALRAEAAKTAMYLSAMDQFYANLEEAKSEFGQTLAFKEKALAQEKQLALKNLDIQQQQVEINQGELGIQKSQLELEKERLDWEKQFQQGQLDYQNANLEAGVDITNRRLDMLSEAQGFSGTQVPQLVPSGVYAGNPGTLYYGPSESVQSSAISYNTPETNFSVSDPWSDLDLFSDDLTAGY